MMQLLPRLAAVGARCTGAGLAASTFGRGLGATVGRSFASEADLLKTPLYDLHVEHGGDSLRSGPLPRAHLVPQLMC